MSGSTTPAGVPVSSLGPAASINATDYLLVFQLNTTLPIPIYVPRQLQVSVLETAIETAVQAAIPPLTLAIGQVATLTPGTPATASLTPTPGGYLLNVGIPTGAGGPAGPAGPSGQGASYQKVASSGASQALSFSGTAGEIAAYDVALAANTAFSTPGGAAASGQQQIILYLRQPAIGATFTPTFPPPGGAIEYPRINGAQTPPTVDTSNGAVTRMVIETVDGGATILWGV